MPAKKLDSIKIVKGSKTYFFDIKEGKDGNLCLEISLTQKIASGQERYQVTVLEEHLKDFADALKVSLKKIKQIRESKKSKSYSVEAIRETHRQAYLPWTADDDEKLEMLFCEGREVGELEEIFGRNKGAIDARIKKLELKEKYGK